MTSALLLTIIGIIVALTAAVILSYKNVFPPIICVVCIIIISVASRLDIAEMLTNNYVSGVGDMVSSVFLMLVFGAVFGEIYAVSGAAMSLAVPMTKFFRGPKSVITGLIVLGTIMRFAGLSMGSFFILYPVAVALFRKYQINRRLLVITLCYGSYTIAVMLPFSLDKANVLCMDSLGTSSAAGLIPGLAGTAVVFVGGLLYLFWQNRAWNRKDPEYMKMYERDTDIPELDEQISRNNIPFLRALVPIIVVVVLFNAFKMNIGLALMLGIICSILLFYKSLSPLEWKETVSNGARKSYPVLLNLACMTGLGTVIRATPIYDAAIDWIGHSGLSPYLLAGVAGNLMAFILASGTSSIAICLSTLGEIFQNSVAQGFDLGNIHRIFCFAICGLDSMPWSGSIVSYCTMAKSSIKESYTPFFWICTILPIVTCFLVVVPLASLGFT